METIVQSIVDVLVASARVAGQKVATDAIMTAYLFLKAKIAGCSGRAGAAVEQLEEAVAQGEDSEQEAALVRKRVESDRLAEDAEIVEAARALLAAIEAERDNPAIQPLFDFDTLRAAKSFELDIESSSPVLRARSATFEGHFKGKVRQPGEPPQKHQG